MRPKDLTVEHLARSADVSVSQLWSFARNPRLRCKPTRVKFVRGKRRPIDAPTELFRPIARRIHRLFKRRFSLDTIVHGGAPGRSCVTAARLHLGRRVVIARDMRDCYPSISRSRLKQSLIQSGFRRDVAILLSSLMTACGQVPQGSPISSDALNLYCRPLDRRLRRASRRMRVPVSRTYDDITASTDDWSLAARIGTVIESVITDAGFEVNQRKKRRQGFQRSNRPQLVHGLQVNRSLGVALPRSETLRFIAAADSLVRGAQAVAPDSIEALARKRATVAGMMYYCRQLDHAPAKHLCRLLRQADTHVARRLRCVGITAYRGKWWLVVQTRDSDGKLKYRYNEPARLAGAWRRRVATQRAAA